MCTANTLQQKIRKRTGNGDLIVNFLADTVEGKYPDAKYHHKLEAAKLLERYGFTDQPDHEESQFWGLIPTPEELAAKKNTPSPSMGEGWDGGEGETDNSQLNTQNSPVTHLDILNYEIAHLIRTETADGHTIAQFLGHVMTRQDKPYTPKKLRIRHIDRFAAAMEILRRGHGHFGRRRKLVVDDYDTLHTDLAKRMREYSEHGTDAIRFLLDVMSAADPDEPYTWHHRVSAAQELIRRGWDSNYDRITPEMLQDYWRNQQSSRLSVGQKKHLAGLPTTLDDYDQYDNEDYQAIAQELREQEDLEATYNRHSRLRGNPSPLSPRERARVRGQKQLTSTHVDEATQNSELETDNSPDCYHEPLNPDKQAIFDYQTQIESGEYDEGEITLRQPTPEDWKTYEYTLREIREIAAAEGVPLLPNPLSDTLKMPNIRSP